MDSIIAAHNLLFSYDNTDGASDMPQIVLNDVSLNIQRGEMVAVLGHNGCGKSTLAKHFNSILVPLSGTIVVDGMNTRDEDRLYDIRQTVGMVFQNPDNQIVATIVEEDVAFALENLGIEPAEIRSRVDDALKDVGMYEYREHTPHQLSGGQKQRVAIAGIIAMRPKCIVLDEPTAMLDPRGRREVMRTIRGLNEKFGITVVLITHYMDEAAKCDRVVVMDAGKVILDSNPKEVFSHAGLLKEVGLDVPQATELTHALIEDGFDIENDIIYDDECVLALEKLLNEAEIKRECKKGGDM